MKAASEIIQLRQVLAERFPQVRPWTEESAGRDRLCWATGLAGLDGLLHGGLPKGAITEVVCGKAGGGSAILLRSLLRQTRQLAALIDGRDSFDPEGVSPAVLSRLLWARCQTAEEAVKAADMVLRDRNVALVALDLKMNPPAQLRKISPTSWYRLQRIAQQGGSILMALTPQPSVSCADVRLTLESGFTLADLNRAPDLKFDLTRWSLAQAG